MLNGELTFLFRKKHKHVLNSFILFLSCWFILPLAVLLIWIYCLLLLGAVVVFYIHFTKHSNVSHMVVYER